MDFLYSLHEYPVTRHTFKTGC